MAKRKKSPRKRLPPRVQSGPRKGQFRRRKRARR